MDPQKIIILLFCLMISSLIGLSVCVYYYIIENKKDEKEQNKTAINGLIGGMGILSSFILLIIYLFYYLKKNDRDNNSHSYSYEKFQTPKNQSKKPYETPGTGDTEYDDSASSTKSLKYTDKKYDNPKAKLVFPDLK
jgi:hypothetical protein